MFSFKEKNAVVSGGTTEVGSACVEGLMKMGLKKCAVFDTKTKANEKFLADMNAKYKNNFTFVECDVSNSTDYERALKKTFDQFGKVDIILNSSSVDLPNQDWKKMMEVNVNGAANSTLLGMKFMGKDNGGSGGTILNVASVLGLASSPTSPLYSATEHAIVGMSRSFSSPNYFDKTGVRVMTVCTGMTENENLRKSNKGVTNKLDLLPVQKPEQASEAIMQVLVHGKNGSVWVSEGGQDVYEIYFPNRIEQRIDPLEKA